MRVKNESLKRVNEEKEETRDKSSDTQLEKAALNIFAGFTS